MKFSDVKTLLLSSGYMKTSNSGGREVVDEMRDASFERNHQVFAGSDRPELHKTLDGFEQVAVEREATNRTSLNAQRYIINSDDGWRLGGDYSVTRTETIFNGRLSYRLQFEGTTTDFLSVWRVYMADRGGSFNINNSYIGPSSVGVFCKNIGDKPVLWTSIRLGGTGIADEIITVNPNEEKYISFESGASGDGSKQLYIGAENEGDNLDIIATPVMAEEEPYLTLFTEGTRLAPSPVIENALPETGTVGWVGKMVRTSDDFIFISDQSASTTQSFLRLQGDNFRCYVFGSDNGQINAINQFDWNLHSFKNLITIVSWSESMLYLWLCDSNGDMYGHSNGHALNSTKFRDVELGGRSANGTYSSIRTHNFKKTTNIINTPEKAKNYIEIITKSSFNLKESEINHMNP